MITREKFLAYEAVRQSGKTSMSNRPMVQWLAANSGVFLSIEEITIIIKDYDELRDRYFWGNSD